MLEEGVLYRCRRFLGLGERRSLFGDGLSLCREGGLLLDRSSRLRSRRGRRILRHRLIERRRYVLCDDGVEVDGTVMMMMMMMMMVMSWQYV